MKKPRLLIAAILFAIAAITAIAGSIQVQEARRYSVFEPYEYPIVPGTTQWVELETNIDKINACRVPDELTKKMATGALLETFLTHPLAGNMFAFDSYHDGFIAIRDYHYTGLGELMQRSDLSDEMLNRYERADMMTTALIEALTAEMDENQRSTVLVSAITEKTRERVENKSAYGGFADTYFRTAAEKHNEEVLNNARRVPDKSGWRGDLSTTT